ncbi:MAG: ChuX/HutX family heme-like substrate-binding protein [Pseudomonadota bacterium]
MPQTLTPEDIRAEKQSNAKMRDRDLADKLGISEAALVAAHIGYGVTPINAHPDALMPAISELGEVMALTRNASAVHERVGTYGDYHSNPHASMVVGEEIDLRIFPRHWVHGFAIEHETEKGMRRTLQVFDAAGDAVHKVFLREGSNTAAWDGVVQKLATVQSSAALDVADRAPTEAPKSNPAKRDILLNEWARMTDTHQFMRLTSKLGMNRLGAYREVAGTDWVRPIDHSAMGQLLTAVSEAGQQVILFVGNRGNIQIHWGPLEKIVPMGPWQNVMDPRFNLHLRDDHVAEVYAVRKPTKRGEALSVEAFDANGMLIFQVFGRRTEADDLTGWSRILADLPATPVSSSTEVSA